MLARLKAAEPDAAYFRRALRLPKPAPEYLAADREAREANANLRALTERREDLKMHRSVQNAVRTQLSDDELHAALDKVQAEITAAQLRDREALAEFNRQKTAYQERVRASLTADIDGLGALINQHINEVFELLDIAGALNAEAREHRVEMPSLIGGAPAAKQFLEASVAHSIGRMTAGKGARP